MRNQEELRETLKQTTAEVLNSDLELALTMARIAADAEPGSEKRARNLQNARKAYSEISRMMGKTLTDHQELLDALTEKLQRLHSMIEEIEAA